MGKRRRVFVCTECGAQAHSWIGCCPQCGAWATLEEQSLLDSRRRSRDVDVAPRSLAAISEIDSDLALPVPTGVVEFDQVLGGGLTAGSSTLLAGEPGVGKSTLTLQLAASTASSGGLVIIVSGEEAPSQIAARARRLGPLPESLMVLDETSVDTVAAIMADRRPQLVIVDSIQTMHRPEVDSAAGSVKQVKASAAALIEAAKAASISLLLIGHVTKDGSIAGPRVLEHMVDTVLTFDGDRSGSLRFLRTVKHRFGPTSELGIFEMSTDGLRSVPDPSDRFLADRQPGLSGSVVLPCLSGRRPYLTELQALAVGVGSGEHTTAQGLAARRVDMLRAVLTCRAGYRLEGVDLFLSVAGGVSVTEPAADLGVALAVASAVDNRPVAPQVVACGEIGLGGEIRSVPMIEARLQEAYRMGFRAAVVPESTKSGPTGLQLLKAKTLLHALELVPEEAQGRPAE